MAHLNCAQISGYHIREAEHDGVFGSTKAFECPECIISLCEPWRKMPKGENVLKLQIPRWILENRNLADSREQVYYRLKPGKEPKMRKRDSKAASKRAESDSLSDYCISSSSPSNSNLGRGQRKRRKKKLYSPP